MPARPNILFFFTDQQRWDTAGCYGNTLGLTPTLDRLAAGGVVFDQAFTCQPVCAPARACLQTGIYATNNGVWHNGLALPPHHRTVAHLANEAGYRTAYIGKWHLGPGDEWGAVPRESRGGWQHWVGANAIELTSHPYGGRIWDGDNQPIDFEQYRPDELTDHALAYLDQHDAAQPFFMILSHLEPHHQNDMNRYVAPHGYAERYQDYPVPGDLEGLEGDWKANLPDYYGICRRLDENLQRVLDKLEERGLRENTVIVFSSDHGSHFCTRNNEYKRAPHDACVRVPMVVTGPGFSGGRRVTQPVSLIDLPATWAELTTGSVPAHFQGRSLLPLASGDSTGWPDSVFMQISEMMVARAVRTPRWKYCANAPDMHPWQHPVSDVYRDDCLYDLECDPHERTNLVRDPESRTSLLAMRELLADWIQRIEGRAPTLLDALPAQEG